MDPTLRVRPFFATSRGLPGRGAKSTHGKPQASYSFRMGGQLASPKAVEWWDTHVYRTHLRSPVTSRPGSPRNVPIYDTMGLSPRALGMKSRPMSAYSSMGSTTSMGGAYPGYVDGVAPMNDKMAPRGGKMPDPMMDTRPMNQGGLADHPLRNKLSEVYRALKLMDHDNDGNLHPTDIVRGLGAIGLSTTDSDTTSVVNNLLTRCMQGNGMILYAPFVYAIAGDQKAVDLIMAKLHTKEMNSRREAQKMAEARAAAAAKAARSGPQLRPGVTADELRQTVAVIKDKMMDKFSGFTGAFRSMDKDGSGYVSRDELMGMMLTLNLNNIRKDVIDTLIDFIDCTNDVEDDDDEGPTDIAYREFARAFSVDDVMTLQNLPQFAAKRTLTPPPPTPPPQNLVASQVKATIQAKFKPTQMREAFSFFDKDKSGNISRAEIKRILVMWGAPLTDDELTELFNSTDKNGDGMIDYEEFCDIVAKTPDMLQTRTLIKNPALRKGVRADDLRRAQHTIQEHILTKFKKYQEAFKFMDVDRTGSITRDELKQGLGWLNLLQGLRPEVVENLLDFIDIDGGDISYREFARVISADDVMSMSPLSIAPASVQRSKGIGRHKMDDMPGAQGLKWC